MGPSLPLLSVFIMFDERAPNLLEVVHLRPLVCGRSKTLVGPSWRRLYIQKKKVIQTWVTSVQFIYKQSYICPRYILNSYFSKHQLNNPFLCFHTGEVVNIECWLFIVKRITRPSSEISLYVRLESRRVPCEVHCKWTGPLIRHEGLNGADFQMIS